jgi:hypothetical protein
MGKRLIAWATIIFHTCTAMIGYHIHGSLFFTIVDYFMAPLVWIKWIIFQEINISIIRETFSFFFK